MGGFLWDIIQQTQLERQNTNTQDLAERVRVLEDELVATRQILRNALERIEHKLHTDIDGDGKIG